MPKVQIDSQHTFTKTFSAQDVFAFAQLSQDDNPVHVNAEYAKNSIFKKQVVHGVLITSMFSKIFGTIYPGNGGIYMSQASKFIKPAYIDEAITATVTLTAFDDEKKRGVFKCEAHNDNGDLILIGEAKILFPKTFYL